VWHQFGDSELKLGWWKHWEMSIGLGGGAAFGLAFWLFNRPAGAARPVLGPWAVRFFAFGGPLWLVLLNNTMGTYDGLSKKIGVESTYTGVAILGVLCAIPVLKHWRGRRMLDLDANGGSLPIVPFLIVQGSIVGGGWLVTYQREWALANSVIAGAYVVYLLGSAWAARRLWNDAR